MHTSWTDVIRNPNTVILGRGGASTRGPSTAAVVQVLLHFRRTAFPIVPSVRRE